MDYFRNSMGPTERYFCGSGIDECNVRDVVLAGGSTRISIVREILQEFFNRKESNRPMRAKTIDLEWVQVYLTGLMRLDGPDAKIKLLAAEVLRGVVGLAFNAHGNRSADELGRRYCVTGEMWENKPQFHLDLNKADSDGIAWQCKHHTGRGITKFHESGAAPGEIMGVTVSKMEESFEDHYQAS